MKRLNVPPQFCNKLRVCVGGGGAVCLFADDARVYLTCTIPFFYHDMIVQYCLYNLQVKHVF